MVDQTKVAGDNDKRAEDGAVPGSVFGLARDAMELGELQMRLLLLDIQNSSANARAAVVYAVIGAVVLLSVSEAALLWVAAALVEWAGWPWVAGLAVAVGVGALLAGVLLLVAWLHWRKGMFTWRRSGREFGKNVAWLKATLGGEKDSPHRSPQSTSSPE
jgi:hypothetical protein